MYDRTLKSPASVGFRSETDMHRSITCLVVPLLLATSTALEGRVTRDKDLLVVTVVLRPDSTWERIGTLVPAR